MCNVIFFHLLFESNKIHCFSKKSFHSHYKNRIYHDNYSSSPPPYLQCFLSAAI